MLAEENSIPCRHNGLDARFQLDNSNRGLFIKIRGLDVEYVGPSCKAVGLVVKCVEDLDWEW